MIERCYTTLLYVDGTTQSRVIFHGAKQGANLQDLPLDLIRKDSTVAKCQQAEDFNICFAI
jgi:hypothetical protein